MQQRLFEEIDEHVADDASFFHHSSVLTIINYLLQQEDLTYEKVTSLTYLDMVLRETLRMYPVGGLYVHAG
jgi:cytochrome P450